MNRRRRRSSIEIMSAIIKQCKKPARQTRIMRGANLSLRQIRKYLGFLEERGLIIKSGNYWIATDKGIKFTEVFERLQNLLKPH